MNNMNQFVWDEMKFFVSRLASLSVSESFRFNNESICVFTNTPSENWIYYPSPEGDYESVKKAAEFFREHDNRAFMWPVHDAESLRHSGLIYAGDLVAMTLEPVREYESDPSVTFRQIKTPDDVSLWANITWRSFDGYGDEASDDFCEFTGALINDHKNISLTAAMYEGKAAGSYLNTVMGGVYFFGVIPEMRRKGIARAMMCEICRHNKLITLQATEAGYKFYKSFGFTEHFRMPVYSNTADIF